MRALLTLVLCAFIPVASAFAGRSDSTGGSGRHIRPLDARTASLLVTGAARSATLRDLIDRIERSNVFVYVGVSPLLKASMAGRLSWMTRSGEFRYLRAAINTDMSPDQMIATLAHELQHVAEVIDEASVVDERSLAALYKRIGHPSQATVAAAWETTAAQETGYRVRRELAAATTAALRTNDNDKS